MMWTTALTPRVEGNSPGSEASASCYDLNEQPYRNLYQTASCRNMSQHAGIGFLLGKSQKAPPKIGERRAIPTLASSLR
jgi:hypothetical protein